MDVESLFRGLAIELPSIQRIPCGVSLICAICDICVTYNCLCALLAEVDVEVSYLAG